MPRLKPETQAHRREQILDAAERCFARAGFHRTTMQDICKEASVSPGALYLILPPRKSLSPASRSGTASSSQSSCGNCLPAEICWKPCGGSPRTTR